MMNMLRRAVHLFSCTRARKCSWTFRNPMLFYMTRRFRFVVVVVVVVLSCSFVCRRKQLSGDVADSLYITISSRVSCRITVLFASVCGYLC